MHPEISPRFSLGAYVPKCRHSRESDSAFAGMTAWRGRALSWNPTNKKRGRRSRETFASPASPTGSEGRSCSVYGCSLRLVTRSPRNTMSERMQGSGWMVASLKAGAGCTVSLVGRFAVTSGLFAKVGEGGEVLRTMVCRIHIYGVRSVFPVRAQ